jgi:hypothetical protein
MEPETQELGALHGGDGPITRAKFEVNTSAKGDVNVSFTIEVQAVTDDLAPFGVMRMLNDLEQDAVQRAARIKRDYLDALALGIEERGID